MHRENVAKQIRGLGLAWRERLRSRVARRVFAHIAYTSHVSCPAPSTKNGLPPPHTALAQGGSGEVGEMSHETLNARGTVTPEL